MVLRVQNRSAEDAYLGLLGPVIRATVGDTIRVTFKNGVPYNTTVHPHGVLYAKDAEGAIYNDSTSGVRCAYVLSAPNPTLTLPYPKPTSL